MAMTRSRLALPLALLAIMFVDAPASVSVEKHSVLVLDTELIDEMKQNPNEPDKPANLVRAERMSAQLRHGLDSSDYYTVVDTESMREIIEQYRSGRHLHRCTPCIIKIGEAAGVDLVVASWTQIVSSLIQNQNLVFYDVKAGDARMTAFTDFRGNNDTAWRNATRALLERFYNKYHDGSVPAGLRNYRPGA